LASLREGSAHSYNKKLQVIPSISLSDVQEYSKYWKTKLYSEILVSGNIDQSAAVSITKGVEQTMKQHSSTLRREDIASIRPVFLPVKQTCIVEETLTSKEDNNCSIIVHYQYEAAQTRTKILQDLALAFIK
jgi:secreted Zn-dependent insulinase-like peptidase